MVKIIIVDDETASLRSMGRVLQSLRDDIEIVGLFNNIQLVKDFLANCSADIIMSDIKMPDGDGIELAQFVYENCPKIKMVFFSAYNDFEYAQQAIKLNVKHYLSKPIDVEELTAMLSKLVEQVKEEKTVHAEQKLKMQKYNDLILMAKTDFYSDILAGFLYDKNDIFNRLKNLDMSGADAEACHGVLMVTCADTEVFPNGREGYYLMISNLMRDVGCLEEYIQIIKHAHEVVLVIRLKESISYDKARVTLERDLWNLKSDTKKLMGVDINFEVAYMCPSVYRLCDYKKMLNNEQLLEMKFRELSTAMVEDDDIGIKRIFDTIACYAKTLDINRAKNIFADMFEHLKRSILDSGADMKSILDYQDFKQRENIEDVVAFSHKAIDKLHKMKLLSSKGVEALTVQIIKDYIKENYMTDIVLDDIAKHVNLSSYYLSKFFKAKTGQGISDYIVSVRINAAMDLIKTQKYKMYQISEMCGYKSRKYFTQAFKNYTGYTPSEYQRIVSGLG